MSNNPLSKHFRQPAIYFKLPSLGRFWPEDALELPANGEIPVYPMTTRDEIVLKTPDALMNGAGIVDVIQSCCPCIKDAWQIPSVDLDAILIAIRIASYGGDMDITSTCPNCNETADYGIPLDHILHDMPLADFNTPVALTDGLLIYLKPSTYELSTNIALIGFQEDRVMKTITDDTIAEDQRRQLFTDQMSRLIDLNVELLIANTNYIEADGQQISDKDFLQEYYKNCDANTTKKIRSHVEKLSEEMEIKTQTISCSDCGHAYPVRLEFDNSNFFGESSSH